MKAVHKALVLKYHPDKLGREATKKDEEAFACITKSAEILSDPQKRRAFDSVDPEFDNSIPKGDSKDLMKNFYEIFEPVFERNSRWAIHRSKVLKLGMLPASRNHQSCATSGFSGFSVATENSHYQCFSWIRNSDIVDTVSVGNMKKVTKIRVGEKLKIFIRIGTISNRGVISIGKMKKIQNRLQTDGKGDTLKN